MVKNLNTIERSERIRIGKHTPDEQAVNSIIINASPELLEADTDGFYVSPIRTQPSVLANTLVYNTVTKEIVDSGENINKSLEDVTLVGNTTSQTIEFQNTSTGFVTTSNVGIANTNPVHTLDVGSKFFIDENASNVMDVTGNVFVSDTLFVVGNLEVLGDTTLTTQQNLLIDDSVVELGKNNYDSGAGFDLGFVMTRSTAVSNVGIGYREAQDEFFLGYTDNNAYEHYLTPNADNNVKFHVYGSIVTDANVGISNTSPIHTLDVGSNLYIDDTASNILVVHGDSKIDETLFANVIEVSGNINALTELNVTGNIHAASNVIVTGGLQALSNADVTRDLNVSGNVHALSELSVTGNTNALSELNVTGNVHASSSVNITGNTNALSELNVTGNVYASSNVDVTQELNVTGNIHASSSVNVTGNTNALSELNVTGNVYASSNVNVSQELNVTGNTNALSELNVTGNVHASKDVIVTGHIFGSSNVVVSNDLAVSRDMYASNVNVNKKLSVTGNVEALSNLNVTGNVFANSNVSVANDLDVSGNVYATRDLITTGNIYATSNIHVSKEAVISGDLYANANAFVAKELTVTRDINASANVDITKDLNVTGNVYANSNVSVSEQLDVSGNTYMNSNAHVSKKLYVTGAIEASSTINATGSVTASYYYGNGSTLSNVTLEQVTSFGNTTSNTIFFNNPDIAVVTDGDMGVGTDTPDHKLHVAGDIRADTNMYAVQYFGGGNTLSNVTLQVVTDKGNTTSNTLQFTNGHTAFTTDLVSNVEVKLDQLSNVVITDPQADNLLVYDGTDWVNDYNLHNFIKVHNTTGSTLYRGNVVYIVDSFNNNVANVALAKSDSSSTMPAIGLIHENILAGDEGVAVAYGKVNGINTTGFIEGQTVYVSNTSAGHIMNTKPYGLTDQIQNVGICIRVHGSNGVIFVTGVGRSNDIPNAPIETVTPPYVYVNTLNNNMRKIVPSNLLTKLQTLEQVVNTGNTVANTINVTGLTATANIDVGGNVSIDGLTQDYLPMIGADNYLVDSPIRKDNGNIIIGSDTEITGNLFITGNSITISSNSLIINDRILGIANNNPSHDLDAGIIIEHPGHNIALIHHGDEDRFSMGYTQNTVTDNHVTPDSNIFFLNVLGNVEVQNSLTVNETVYAPFFDGDGGLLSNLATNFEEIIINGNTTSNTVEFRGATSLVTTGSVGIANTEPGHDLSVGSNLYVDDDGSNVLHVTGNIYATSFIGDGSQLDNIASNLEEIVNNGNVASNTIQLTNTDVGLVATGNIQANYFIGDGSQLDNIASNLEEIVNNGNVASNTIQFTNPDVGLVATGNIQANYFIGDGSQLDNIASNLEEIVNNGNVASNTIQLTNTDVGLVATGNIQANYFIGDGSQLDNIASNLEEIVNNGNVASNTIQLINPDVGLVATGNIQANYFIGDGSQLDNIASNLEEIVLNGNVTSQTIHIQNTVSLTTTGNVGIANTNPTCHLAVGSNVCFDDTSSNILTVDGNILAHRITLDSIQIASVYALEYVTMEGNTTSNTVEFTNASTGLVTTANVGVANSNPVHTLDVGSNLWVDDVGSNVLYVNGNVHVAGSQLTTDGKVGIGNTAPGHDLSVASNLYVDDGGSNVLVVSGNASFGHTITLGAVEITTAYDLEEVTGEGNTTSNVIQFTNSNVGIVTTGGIVTHTGGYACKRYSYSNVSIPTGFSNVGLTFASNVFYAKVTAQLLHGNEEVSTLVYDAQGGTRDGTESSLDVAIGSKALFGSTNTKPWSSVVTTTPTMVIMEPSAAGTQTYGCDLFVEYMSSAPDGKLESISVDANTVKSFIY